MAVKKIEIRPKGTGDYADVLYPKTSDDMVEVTDVGNKFTATKLDGVLDELFTSANSVKTNVSSAIGLPATASDTGTQLASKITTEKGKLATEIGDGSSASTLQYLADRLKVRSDAIATAVNSKGTPATSADTLAQLATKIGQINTANIKSIQSGILNFTTQDFLNATLTSVDPTKSIVVLNHVANSGQGAVNTSVMGTVVDATTVQVQRGGTVNSTLIVSWTVIEFMNVKSVQNGTTSLPSASSNVTGVLSSVNVSKSICFTSFMSDSTSTDAAASRLQYYISGSTAITLKHYGSLGNKTVRWCVVEFN